MIEVKVPLALSCTLQGHQLRNAHGNLLENLGCDQQSVAHGTVI